MPINVSASTVANAPKDVVWDVLADFPNIANYTSSVKTSVSTSEHANGVGASRTCNLAPLGSLDEEIIEFEPGDRLVISVHSVKGMPVKRSITTFSVSEIDSETTELTMSAEVEPKGGLISGLVGKILQRRMPKASKRVINDLAAASERIASAKSG